MARNDGARRGNLAFYDLLHGGHESVTLDFRTEQPRLMSLLCAADVVLEASRPRTLRGLGIDAGSFVADGALWVSITAYGRDGVGATRVGFGDDVASGAGLVGWKSGQPFSVGDAIADPLTGVVAAAAAQAALTSGRGWLLDVSMHDVALAAALLPPSTAGKVVQVRGEWFVEVGGSRHTVADPSIRPPAGVRRGR